MRVRAPLGPFCVWGRAFDPGSSQSAEPPKPGGLPDGIDADFEGKGVAVAGGSAGSEAALLGGALAVDAAEGVPGARLQGELGVDGVAVHGATRQGAFVAGVMATRPRPAS